MKIISKYKDYYDYLQGIYGIDNKVVLDRTTGSILHLADNLPYEKDYFTIKKFAICDKMYSLVISRSGKIYIGDSIRKIARERKAYFTGKREYYVKVDRNEWRGVDLIPVDTDLNKVKNCPIIGFDCLNQLIKYPKLETFKISAVYPAEQIFTDLYNWIIKINNPDTTDKRTDIEKVESHGFDKITSFRKM